MPLTQPKAISSYQGFTLIELVIVIIVLGVLAATAGPKLIGKSAFEDYAVRDQLISRLRLVQLQGMNADPNAGASENACYWLVVKKSCFYHEHTATKNNNNKKCKKPQAEAVCDNDNYNQYNPVTYSDGMLAQKKYRFDLQGRLFKNNNNKLISEPFKININGDNDLAVSIEIEGYIHESRQK